MKLEKYLSEYLRKYPDLRNNLKLIYQRINYTIYSLPKSKNKVDNEINYLDLNISGEHFFGYYDKSPWNIDNNKILTTKIPFSHRHPTNGEPAIIGFIDLKKDNNFVKIAESKTWNLQQGTMLQWLGLDFNQKIIYNDLHNDNYVSKVQDINTNQETILDLPVYSVDQTGLNALSLNFSRLNRLRKGYGYSNLKDKTENKKYPKDDGIWILDIDNNKYKLLLSYYDLFSYKTKNTMKDSEHRINHLDFNPSGNRFSFIHRWKYKNETYSRLFTLDIHGNNLYCLADNMMVSHTCWKDDNQLLAWSRNENNNDYYHLYQDLSSNNTVIGKGILTEDGHPSYSNNKRYILTDTYPDRKRYRKLIIYDTKDKTKHLLGEYFATFKYKKDSRCDLHPRWSRDNKYISFDSVHQGLRKQYIVENPLR